MSPICCNCRLAMRCQKNDFIVCGPTGGGFPSTYWAGDKFRCPSCGHEVAVGFGASQDAETARNLGWTEQAMEFAYQIDAKSACAEDNLAEAARALSSVLHQLSTDSDLENVSGASTYAQLERLVRSTLAKIDPCNPQLHWQDSNERQTK